MRMKRKMAMILALFWSMALLSQPNEQTNKSIESRLQELENRLDEASNESLNKLNWGAYGEMKYIDYMSDFKKDISDVHRIVLLAEYEFDEEYQLIAEIEYEHAGFEEKTVGTSTVNSSEVFIEQAYINYQYSDEFGLQAGLLLVPVGITNLYHEPVAFLPVERSRSESLIIPSTWRELGVQASGKLFEKLDYKVGILNGPRGSGFGDSSWIRGGRTKGSKARTENIAGVIGFDYAIWEGISAGVSYYRGDAGQGELEDAGWKSRIKDPVENWIDNSGLKSAYQEISNNANKKGTARVHLADAHLAINHGPWMGRMMLVRGWMNEKDTRNVNRTTGKNVGKLVEGAYGELGFNVLSFFTTSKKLYPFFRLEYVNTQKQTVERHMGGQDDIMDAICNALNQTCVETSTASRKNRDFGIIESKDSFKEKYGVKGVASRTNDQRILTLGMAFYPNDSVVVKAEYERQDSKSDYHSDIESRNSSNNKIDRFQFGVGFSF